MECFLCTHQPLPVIYFSRTTNRKFRIGKAKTSILLSKPKISKFRRLARPRSHRRSTILRNNSRKRNKHTKSWALGLGFHMNRRISSLPLPFGPTGQLELKTYSFVKMKKIEEDNKNRIINSYAKILPSSTRTMSYE